MVSIWELEGIIQWACYGMEQPNMLRFDSEVRYRRWHGNYIRCFVKIGKWIDRSITPTFFVPGKITAVVEFVGNTLRADRSVILFSEFEASKWAVWNTGVAAFKRSTPVRYNVYVEIWNGTKQIVSKSFKLQQEAVFRFAKFALSNISDEIVRNQLRLFFENYYFLPRKRENYMGYAGIDEYDNLWAEDFPDLDDVPPPDLIMEEVDTQ